MIARVDGEPCWVLELNSEGDEVHFRTAEAAADYITTYGLSGTSPRQLPVACWVASCDGEGCLEVEGDEDGDRVHLPAYTLGHALSDLSQLRRVGGWLLCQECATPAFPGFRELLDQAGGLFNQLAPDLPALTWSVGPDEVRGQADVAADDQEVAATLTAWSDRLALVLDEDQSVAGMREYTADRAGWRLVVWGVVDHAAWADGCRELIEAN